MIVGIPREIKKGENRVSITPAGVHEFIAAGHEVLVEKNAGAGSGIEDHEYEKEGARLIDSSREIFKHSDMIMKVKEPQVEEIDMLQKGQVLYTYLHLAADRELTVRLADKEIIGIAYETIELNNKLPLLEPMSEIAGKVASLMGAFYSAKAFGGNGILTGGVAGVHSASYVILGGGTAGLNAAKIAAGLGARVVVMDVNLERMRYLEDVLPKNCEMIMSNKVNIAKEVQNADVLIGTVLIPGARAPKLISRDMLKTMRPGTVIVDVAIDQGGCTETSKPTSHSEPVYSVDRIIHYCVANIPGTYPRSATFALTNTTLQYGLLIAGKGWQQAAREHAAIYKGINIAHGKITCRPVAESHGLPFVEL